MKNKKYILAVIIIILLGGFVWYAHSKNTTVVTLAPIVTPGGADQTYTMADVAMHNTAADCWTAINGGVYNVTSWIPQHPGGTQAIISLCGTDGSNAFNAQHGGQARPASELASFRIGTLQ